MTAQTIFPHLVVNGATAALEFYKKALGATEVMRLPAEDGGHGPRIAWFKDPAGNILSVIDENGTM